METAKKETKRDQALEDPEDRDDSSAFRSDEEGPHLFRHKGGPSTKAGQKSVHEVPSPYTSQDLLAT